MYAEYMSGENASGKSFDAQLSMPPVPLGMPPVLLDMPPAPPHDGPEQPVLGSDMDMEPPAAVDASGPASGIIPREGEGLGVTQRPATHRAPRSCVAQSESCSQRKCDSLS